MNNKNPTIRMFPKFLWIFMSAYSLILVCANWFDARLVTIFTLTTDAGTLIFPLTFLFSDLITEIYGYKNTRIAIWMGFLFNFVFLGFGFLVVNLPSPPHATNNELFNSLLSINIRILCASIISYFIAEPLNSLILAKLKIRLQGRFMPFRFIFSTLIASGCDSTIFSFLAFYNTMALPQLIELILTMWFLKVMIEIVCLPVSITLAKKLKKVENLDIYDNTTAFSIFNFDMTYQASDNASTKQKT